MPDDRNMGEEAGRSVLGGFSGCLGVGLAIIFVVALLAGGCAVLISQGHHSGSNGAPAPSASPSSYSSDYAFTTGSASAPDSLAPAVSVAQSGSCTLTVGSDPANAYYHVRTVLAVSAPGQITIRSVAVEVLGSGGTEIGSLSDVQPQTAASTTVSWPLVVSSGTVPLAAVAAPNSLSGQFSPACKVTNVSYDMGNTAP